MNGETRIRTVRTTSPVTAWMPTREDGETRIRTGDTTISGGRREASNQHKRAAKASALCLKADLFKVRKLRVVCVQVGHEIAAVAHPLVSADPHRRVLCTGSLTPGKSRPDLCSCRPLGNLLARGGANGRSDARHPQCLRCYLPQQVEQFVDAADEFGLTDHESIAEQGKRVGADGGAPTVDRPPGLWHRANARHR